MTDFEIAGRKIGTGRAPYIIAEMSANHNGNINNAFRLIESAKMAGADAIKIQTYTAETITLDCDKPDFQITEGLWSGNTLYQLYKWAHTPWEWHRSLFEHATKVGITIFSSPFDSTAVDLLEDLNTPAYKIASFEAIDIPLIRYAASTAKPLIISTGMANQYEIEEAVSVAREAGCKSLALLHCVSAYPAEPADYNLATIPDMARRFGVVAGISDHTLSNNTAIASIALGASIVEKHFTLDRQGGGPDDSFSLEPDDLKKLCATTKEVWEALGDISYDLRSSEMPNIKFRRSLYFVKDMIAGEEIKPDCVRSIRPGYGLPPKMITEVIGAIVKTPVSFGTPVTMEVIEPKAQA